MKNRSYILNTLLAVTVGLALAACVLVRTFAPAVVLPRLDIPNMALLSLITLVVDHYLARGAKRCYICIPVFAVLTFGVLPYVSGFADLLAAVKIGLIGGAVFTILTLLYSTIQERLSSGPAVKAAPLLSALGLYLAFQIFSGMIL